jgi:hypothetical protein
MVGWTLLWAHRIMIAARVTGDTGTMELVRLGHGADASSASTNVLAKA